MKLATRYSSIFFKITFATLAILLGNLTALAQSAETFDIDRYSTLGAGFFETFFVDETQSLQAALDAGTVSAEMDLLVTETATGNLALLIDQMGYHHIAQGTAGGKDWMATF